MVRPPTRHGQSAFTGLAIGDGLLYDGSDGPHPFRLHGWTDAGSSVRFVEEDATYFGYVLSGACSIRKGNSRYEIEEGHYFSLVPPFELEGGTGALIGHIGFRGLNTVGGPLEASGRLRYIDGCTDTLLIGPPRMGAPCLNALFFPPNTAQTAHTHPSARVGCVVSGAGVCVTPQGEQPLVPGMAFVIHEEGLHSFHTAGEPLIVIAYHPDSDFGPQDEDHPMINRTIVNGVSAAKKR